MLTCWLASDPLLSPSGPAGVTTVITGNCGVGCAPTRATEADREFMIGMLGAIEVSLTVNRFAKTDSSSAANVPPALNYLHVIAQDIPAEVLRQGTKWDVDGEKDWESFPE